MTLEEREKQAERIKQYDILQQKKEGLEKRLEVLNESFIYNVRLRGRNEDYFILSEDEDGIATEVQELIIKRTEEALAKVVAKIEEI